MNTQQKNELSSIFVGFKNIGKLDYVTAWYKKAVDYINTTEIRCAFVSTNSICQGEQVAILWKPLFEVGLHIDFAYNSFIWDSEANIKANVYCIIVGFSVSKSKNEFILYDKGIEKKVRNINAYLIDGENVFIETRKKTLCNVPPVTKGSSPVDGGNLFVNENEIQLILKQNPNLSRYIKKFYGAKEFLHNLDRYCLWLDGISPNEIKSSSLLIQKIQATKEFRLASSKLATQKYAQFPTRFMEIRQPNSKYILIPRHTSKERKYIPFGFMDENVICGDANCMIPNATLIHFGVLTSSVHMTWIKTVCGRLGEGYRYSNDIVYNNFPWCDPSEEQKAKIEQSAQAILDARALYPNSSLADLYDPLLMPIELRKAHEANDKAVMKAYGFKLSMSEDEIVAELFKMYKELVDEKK